MSNLDEEAELTKHLADQIVKEQNTAINDAVKHEIEKQTGKPFMAITASMPVHKVQFFDWGMWGMGFNHDMPCAVYHGDSEGSYAVLNTNKGVFEPSWKAQKEGWQLVQAKTRFQRFLLRRFFDKFN